MNLVQKNAIEKIYPYYQKQLRHNNAIDFDDMLIYTIQLFEKHPEILKYYQEQYQYIHVDEYQDTNHIQYCLVKLLSAGHQQHAIQMFAGDGKNGLAHSAVLPKKSTQLRLAI